MNNIELCKCNNLYKQQNMQTLSVNIIYSDLNLVTFTQIWTTNLCLH